MVRFFIHIILLVLISFNGDAQTLKRYTLNSLGFSNNTISSMGEISIKIDSNSTTLVGYPIPPKLFLDTTVFIQEGLFCAGDSIKLYIKKSPFNKWYENGTLIAENKDTIITKKSATYYAVMEDGFGYTDSTRKINTKFDTYPDVTLNLSGDSVFCDGKQAVIRSNRTNGSNIVWLMDGQPITNASDSLLIKKAGTYFAYASSPNNCKTFSKTKYKIVVNPLPHAPTVRDTAYCQNQITDTLKYNANIGNTFLWYISTTSASSNIAPKPITSMAGSYNYYVSQLNNTTFCESPKSKLTVTINDLPAAPITSAVSYCSGAIATALIATSTTGNNLLWYGQNATGGSSSNTSPIPLTINTGSSDYFVSQRNQLTGCESPRSLLTVKINPIPVEPVVNSYSFCLDVTSSVLSATANVDHILYWYGSNATGGSGSTSAPSAVTKTVGVYDYYVSQRNNLTSCESVRSKIVVTINETPGAPKADNVALCVGATSTSLIANASAGHTLLWYGSNATGGQSSKTAPIPSTNNKGSVDYYVSQLNNTTFCESPRTKLSITVFEIPTTPNLTRDTANYLSSSAINGNSWYKDGVLLNDTLTKFKPTASGAYSVKTLQNGCISPMSSIYYFLVTDIINLSATEFIKLAPNPFQTKLNFDFVVKGYQKLNMDVFELATGRKVTSRVGLTPGSPVYLPELVGGTYIVRITSADGKLSYQFKMVKM